MLRLGYGSVIDPLHKSHDDDALVSYPMMHHFVTEKCMCVHISVTNGALWDICPVHYGICEMDLLHPIWNWRHVNVLSHPSHNSVHSRTPLCWRGHKKVTVMVMNNQLTFFSLHVNQLSQSWDKAISYFDLENPRPRSRVWLKGKVIHSAQYEIDLLPFLFYINQTNNSWDTFTVEPFWKGQECLTKVAKFGACTILYKSCLFYP